MKKVHLTKEKKKKEIYYIYSQNLEKIQLDFNWILNFASYVLFNF